MSEINNKLKQLLHKEGLDNFRIYYANFDDFEEFPIFSRWSRVSFLNSFSFNEKNKFLIKNGLHLVDEIIKRSTDYLVRSEINDYFVCLSLTDWDMDSIAEINCLTPSVYVSRRKKWILQHLNLGKHGLIEEYLIDEYLNSLSIDDSLVFSSSGFNNSEYKRIYIVNKRFIRPRN